MGYELGKNTGKEDFSSFTNKGLINRDGNGNGDEKKKTTSKKVKGGTLYTTTTITPGGEKIKPKNLPSAEATWHKVKDRFKNIEEYKEYIKDYWGEKTSTTTKFEADPTKDISKNTPTTKTSKTSKNISKKTTPTSEEKLVIERIPTKPITNIELKERVKNVRVPENLDDQYTKQYGPLSRSRTFGKTKYGTPKPSKLLTSVFGPKDIKDVGVEDKYTKMEEKRKKNIEEKNIHKRNLTWVPLTFKNE